MSLYNAGKEIADLQHRVSCLEAKLAAIGIRPATTTWGDYERGPDGLVMPGRPPVLREFPADSMPPDQVPDLEALARRTLQYSGTNVCGGSDDRVQNQTNPHNTDWRRPICYLASNTGYVGTGTLISPRCVLTCAHVVIPAGVFPQHIDVVPCQFINSSAQLQQPLGWTRATRWRIHPKYVHTSPDRIDHRYDVGVVILPNDSIYDNVGGTFGVMSPTDSYLRAFLPQRGRRLFHTYGYPMDLPLKGCITEVSGHCYIEDYDGLGIYHLADVAGGQSGAPMFTSENGRWTVFGLIALGRCPAATNVSKRIDDESFQLIAEWVRGS